MITMKVRNKQKYKTGKDKCKNINNYFIYKSVIKKTGGQWRRVLSVF